MEKDWTWNICIVTYYYTYTQLEFYFMCSTLVSTLSTNG